MDKEIANLLALLIEQSKCDDHCPKDCTVDTAFHQTLVRHNEQAAAISANFLQNAQNQQSSTAALLMKLTADITRQPQQ